MTERKLPERDDAELRTSRRILEAADAARRRLARDIHDGAQQQLVAAVINLQLAQQKFPSDPPRAKQLLDSGLAQAEAGIGALRDMVAGIHPPILTHLGLNAAIEALATGLPVPVSLVLSEQRLPQSLEASVYFFVSEALTNVVKHAEASNATVVVASADARLVVEVSDDGIGGATLAGGGSGLMGLEDRVKALDGALTISSAKGAGTLLRAVIPLASTDPV
jgi:signal transduction histidine kinase